MIRIISSKVGTDTVICISITNLLSHKDSQDTYLVQHLSQQMVCFD